MNTKIMRQIVEESKDIPDKTLNFNTWWCDEDGIVTMCPIGNHIINHPTLIDKLNVNYETMSHKGHYKKALRISLPDVSEYLDISVTEANVLFADPCLTREEFVELIDQFVNGEIDIRECQNCNIAYITDHEDRASICCACKEDLLAMCGV